MPRVTADKKQEPPLDKMAPTDQVMVVVVVVVVVATRQAMVALCLVGILVDILVSTGALWETLYTLPVILNLAALHLLVKMAQAVKVASTHFLEILDMLCWCLSQLVTKSNLTIHGIQCKSPM
jgi:hypothetical protein